MEQEKILHRRKVKKKKEEKKHRFEQIFPPCKENFRDYKIVEKLNGTRENSKRASQKGKKKKH